MLHSHCSGATRHLEISVKVCFYPLSTLHVLPKTLRYSPHETWCLETTDTAVAVPNAVPTLFQLSGLFLPVSLPLSLSGINAAF